MTMARHRARVAPSPSSQRGGVVVGGQRQVGDAVRDVGVVGVCAVTRLLAQPGDGGVQRFVIVEDGLVEGGRGPVAGTKVPVVDGEGQGKQQRGRVALPAEDLGVILEPVRLVWARLERPAARRLAEAATRSELATVSGFVGRSDAPQVLADRLARRLADQLRLGGPIKDPAGWLLSRGLPQRQECGDALCDDRMLLDSGRDCPRCEDQQADRHAQRRAVAAAVDDAMPYATAEERRQVVDRQLHEAVTAQAWAREHRWEQVRARQAAAANGTRPAGQGPPPPDRVRNRRVRPAHRTHRIASKRDHRVAVDTPLRRT
ncbi:hypothetical protein [Streptomyces sp. NPDC001340]